MRERVPALWHPQERRFLSPFAGAESSEQRRSEETFLSFFDICVETRDEAEEAWAYDKLRAVFADAFGMELDDVGAKHVPFFEAMRWAAQESQARPAA
jgi:hypothetical protein